MFQSIIAESKASKKIQQQVSKTILDVKPVVLQAPPGTGKTFIAKLIHAQSQLKKGAFAEIDCAKLPRNEAGLVNQLGIIPISGRGTLLIDNVHLLSKQEWERLIRYLKKGGESSFEENDIFQFLTSDSWARLIIASPNKINLSDIDNHNIKLVTLAQRRADIPKFAATFVEQYCQEKGQNLFNLNQAVLRRLISYDYRGNLTELESIIERAVWMTPEDESVIPEQLLWSVESKKMPFELTYSINYLGCVNSSSVSGGQNVFGF